MPKTVRQKTYFTSPCLKIKDAILVVIDENTTLIKQYFKDEMYGRKLVEETVSAVDAMKELDSGQSACDDEKNQKITERCCDTSIENNWNTSDTTMMETKVSNIKARLDGCTKPILEPIRYPLNTNKLLKLYQVKMAKQASKTQQQQLFTPKELYMKKRNKQK